MAQRLGLRYEDGGTYLLLSDPLCRVRIYPNTHMISLDGQDQALRGYMARSPMGVTVPGPAVAIIEGHVATSRAARGRLSAAQAPLPKPPSLAPQTSSVRAAPATPKTVAPAPRAAVAPTSVAPDPAWVVAPTARDWRWIVLHHSDDTSGCLSKYHQCHLDKGWEHGCGYHFVIGNGSQSGDGAVEVSNRWRQQLQGAHAKTPDNLYNEHGVGICLVGNFEVGTDRPTAAQMRSLARLIQFLIDRYGIAPSRVVGHSDCKATCCPGRNFPWAELRAMLRPPGGGALPGATAPARPAFAQPLAIRPPSAYGPGPLAPQPVAPAPAALTPVPPAPAAPRAAVPGPRWATPQLGTPPADALPYGPAPRR